MAILTPEERVGTTIAEKYSIEGVLGEGGWGVVLAGTHLWTDREVAIKLLHPQHARKDAMVKRFLKEAKAAARIKHPNVVDVLDMGRADDDVYLVLERLHGRTLRDLLDEEGPLGTREALDILLPVLDALAEAHDRKIIHRDIKPDNIFLANERERVVPKLLDFGIAKMMEHEGSVTSTGTVVGTPSYMAPEQVEGAKDITTATDVWSMGIVLFECLTGELPFGGTNVASVLVSIVTTEPPRLASLCPELGEVASVIDRALSRAASDRYAGAGELRAALVAAAVDREPPPRVERKHVRSDEHAVTREASLPFEATLGARAPAEDDEQAREPTPPPRPSSAKRPLLVPVASAAALVAVAGVVIALVTASPTDASPQPSSDPRPAAVDTSTAPVEREADLPIGAQAPAEVPAEIHREPPAGAVPRAEDTPEPARLGATPEPAAPRATRPRRERTATPEPRTTAPEPRTTTPEPRTTAPEPRTAEAREVTTTRTDRELGSNDALIIE